MYSTILLLCTLSPVVAEPPKPGDIFTMKKEVGLPTHEGFYRDYVKFRTANDRTGIAKMEANAQLLRVRPGDQVRVLAVDGDLVEVRVVKGSRQGFSGFLDVSDLNGIPTTLTPAERLDRVRDDLAAILREAPSSPEASQARKLLSVLNTVRR